MNSKNVRTQRVLALVLALLTGACPSGPRLAEQATIDFMEAVQRADFDRLYCLMAGAAELADPGSGPSEREQRFRSWAEAELAAYEQGRDDGWVELDGHGIQLVRLFALGRGTFYVHGPTRRVGQDGIELTTDLRFGYAQLDLSRLSPGTTFYVAGNPPGRAHAVRVPGWPQETSLEALSRITVAWTLVRSPAVGSCHEGWRVADVRPVEGSEATSEIRWNF